MQTFTDYIKSKNYPLHLVFVWGRSYSYLDHVLSGNGHTQSLYNLMKRALPSSLLSWMSFLDSNILHSSIWNWTSESKVNVCNGRKDRKVMNLPIWNIFFTSFHKKTKCLKLKVALKRKIYKQNVYDLPLGCCQIYSRALWELFFLFYKPLENEIYVAPIHKRFITYHTVPILEP